MALTDIDAQRLGDSVGDKLGNRNLIINGAMNVAQRGTSSTSAGFGTVDRFRTEVTSGTVTSSQESLTTGSPYDEGFRNFYRLTNSTASSDNAAGERAIRHMIEAQYLANSGWNYASSSSYVTLSFWVRASVSQEYYVYLRTRDGTSQRYAISIGTLTANTWTKITKTIPGNSNLTFNNDNGLGLELFFNAFQGTDSTDSGVSLNAWAAYSSSTKLPDMTTTWSTTTNATFDITGVQLEVGNTATPFEHRSFGDELARCQRYYTDSRDDKPSDHLVIGQAISSARIGASVFFPQSMRANPSMTIYSPVNETAGKVAVYNNVGVDLGSGFIGASAKNSGFYYISSGTGLTTGSYYAFSYSADAEL